MRLVVPKEVLIYETLTGEQPFTQWLFNLKDLKTRQIIVERLKRLSLGNTGDSKSIGSALFELRISYGPGYRVYYTEEGTHIVLLLCAGDKSTQRKDIRVAEQYLNDYRSR